MQNDNCVESYPLHFSALETMAAFEAALSSLPSLFSSTCSKPLNLSSSPKPLNLLRISNFVPPISHNFLFSPSTLIPVRNLSFELLCTAVQEITSSDDKTSEEQESEEKSQQRHIKKKLYVTNLPWSLTVVDIKNFFAECGDVIDVEIIKQLDGRSRGFAFITMASGEEAQAVIDRFDSTEVSGRTIKIELAKQFKKPSPRPLTPQVPETRHKLYVSNLAWKARSSHLRDFFSLNFKAPVSARVVFDGPSGKSGGYGFVSFTTKEEAEGAISALNGQELMGRPVILKFSEKNVGELGSKEEKDDSDQNKKEEEENFEDKHQDV